MHRVLTTRADAQHLNAGAIPCDVAVVVLTLNEELNLRYALESVAGWAREIFVVDSHSIDRTVELARELGALVFEHTFED